MKISKIAMGALASGALVVTTVGLYARLMNYEMRRDEQLYVSPAALPKHQRLYEDFFYNHVPGSVWFYDAAYAVFGAGGLLFSARTALFFVWIAFAAAIAFFAWRLTRSIAAVVASVTLIVANDFLLGVVGSTATNNFLPLPFAFVGLCLFALGISGQGILNKNAGTEATNQLTIFAAGVALALSLSLKISAIAFIGPVACAAFLLPGSISFLVRLRTVVLPLALGGLVGAAPVLFEFLRAPELFVAHVFQYHTGPHIAYWSGDTASDEDVALGIGAKAMLAHQIWFGGVTLLLMFAAIIVFTTSLFVGQKSAANRGPEYLAVAVGASVALFGFAPTPAFPQYFAPLTIALLFAVLISAPRAITVSPKVMNVAFAGIAALAFFVGAPRLAQHATKITAPERWMVSRVHDAGTRIAAAMKIAGVEGKVLTLLPIYPLEGGLDVYPEFATGQFVYRTADLTNAGLLEKYRTTTPSRIAKFLSEDPPAAMLLGFEPDLEAPMAAFAEARGYRRVEGLEVKDRYGDGYLLIRPDALQ